MQKVTSIDRMDLASNLIYPMLNGTAATVPETPFQAYVQLSFQIEKQFLTCNRSMYGT
jgi:hypothetical protein